MTYSRAKVRGQRSVVLEDRVETNGLTDGRREAIALPPSLMRSVKLYEVLRFVGKKRRFGGQRCAHLNFRWEGISPFLNFYGPLRTATVCTGHVVAARIIYLEGCDRDAESLFFVGLRLQECVTY